MIEVGEYVRFENGKIRKIVGRDEDKHLLVDISYAGGKWLTFNEEATIVKHNKDIKKLLEEGDLVNGKEVYEFDDEEGTVLGIPIFEDGLFDTIDCYVPLDSIKIHSILTSEMYEANCYKVKEEIC